MPWDTPDPNIIIEGPARVVKGFPVVLKVKAKGPMPVPRLSLFNIGPQIMFVFTCKATSHAYWFDIEGLGHKDYTRADGSHVSASQVLSDSVKAGEKRTMLMELNSLYSPFGSDPSFSDVPPGRYSVYVIFKGLWKGSNRIPMEIVAPTRIEQRFLDDVFSYHRKDVIVNWTRFVRKGERIPKTYLKGIGKGAKSQMGFHLLLSEVLSSESPLKDISLEPLRRINVPEYLKPERECLFLEIDAAAGRNVAAKAKSLERRHRGLEWRLKAVKKNKPEKLTFLKRKLAKSNRKKKEKEKQN